MLDRHRAPKPKIAIKVLTFPNATPYSNFNTPNKPSLASSRDDSHCYSPIQKPKDPPLRKSQSKQEFRRPIINSSKLPQGFFSNKKPTSPAFSNSPKNKPQLEPIFNRNPIIPLKKFLDFSKQKEIEFKGETSSHFKRKYQEFLLKNNETFKEIELRELIAIRNLEKKGKSSKKLVFHANSLKLYVLEQFPLKDPMDSKEKIEEIKEISNKNPGFVRIFKVFYETSQGLCHVLREYMTGGSLSELLDFSGSVNFRSSQAIFLQLDQMLETFPKKIEDFELFFDKKGNLKLEPSFFKTNKPKRQIKDIIYMKCLFGDLFDEDFLRKKQDFCCLFHGFL